ncbi:hypothetical protein Hamer_G022251 [Homarus americanus]|uniref:Uncharacterized protein n=1 Tax=Homarus americanus TaxID=6706 RepID=A0A8J5K8A5_HOMAM|nr:hypothetical protein Hamer_G022251 [Homarus americanus]
MPPMPVGWRASPESSWLPPPLLPQPISLVVVESKAFHLSLPC